MTLTGLMKHALAAFAVVALAACETVQTTESGMVGVEREQRMAISAEALEQAADQQYAEIIAEARQKGILNRDPAQVARVRRVVERLIPQTTYFRPDARNWNWETNVLDMPEANAWAMPGGKIAVYSGLIEQLNLTDAELAAVLGHEISHALREHARERASEQMFARGAISIGAALFGLGDVAQQGAEMAYMGLLGLPNSRQQETEADRIGVELAARAGYDPRAAVSLWEKMGQIGGASPPEFLSTHPPREDRLSDLRVYAQRVMPLYQQAR